LYSHKPLSATKLLRDSNKNIEHLFSGIGVIGWMNENMLLRISSVEAAYLGGVCVILILKA
jgi:hypothetical protein